MDSITACFGLYYNLFTGSNLHNEGIEGGGDSCILCCIPSLGFAEPNALKQLQNVFIHVPPLKFCGVAATWTGGPSIVQLCILIVLS